MKTLVKTALAGFLLVLSVLYSVGPIPQYGGQETDAQLVSKPFVTDQAAYAHYMPPNYAVRFVYCRIVWPDGAEYVYVCASQTVAHFGRDPSEPIQWDPNKIRMLHENPN